MLAGDINILELDNVVQYRVSDAAKWLFMVKNPEKALDYLSQSSMRLIIGQGMFDKAATSGHAEIQDDTRGVLADYCTDFDSGVFLVAIKLQGVHPPGDVMAAFKDVTNAKEGKQTRIREAEGYVNNIVPIARGDAKKMIQDAKGYAVERVDIALGDSARFVDVVKEYRKNKQVTRDRLRLESILKTVPGSEQWIILEESGLLKLMDLTKLEGGQS